MATKPLTADQRNRVAEKVMELGNLSLAGVGLAQFATGRFDVLVFTLGVLLFLECYIIAHRIMRGGGSK